MSAVPGRISIHKPLSRSFYARDVVMVARDLLGKHLVRNTPEGITVGRIVEVEAYLRKGDPASHCHRGRTRRNTSMFGPPGHAYVYSIHARFCFNAVAEQAGVPGAVLIRAVEPLQGMDLMSRRRGTHIPRQLTRGPARLCEAFAVTGNLDGWDLTRGESLWVASCPGRDTFPVVSTRRIGVTAAAHRRLRFIDGDSPHVSRPRMGR